MLHTVTIYSHQQSPDRDFIGICNFQFGELAAPENKFKLTKVKIPANSKDEEIFKFDSDIKICENMHVRFNLTLQINTHNVTNVQIRINSDKSVQWRWFAPHGEQGKWTSTNDQATWQDGGNKYLIYMVHKPGQSDFWIYLGQIPMMEKLPLEFFPRYSLVPKQLQFNNADCS